MNTNPTTIDTAVPGRRIDIRDTSIGPSLRITNTDTGRSINANLTGDEPHRIAAALRGREPGDEYVDWKSMHEQAERTCDELRSLIEGQKEHVTKAQRERDDEKSRSEFFAKRADKARHERDAAVARAEQAENARDTAATRAAQLEKAVEANKAGLDIALARIRELKAKANVAVTRADVEKAMADAAPGLVPYGACVDAVHALVSGTAPAVTKAEIEQAIRNTSVHYDCDCTQDEACAGLADEVAAVWSLVSGADPAVYVVRESDLPHMEDDYLRNFDLSDGRGKYRNATDEEILEAREMAESNLRWLIAVQQHIEAEQAVDQVEAKVTTRHPEHYRLVNEADGTEWRMTRDGAWERAEASSDE